MSIVSIVLILAAGVVCHRKTGVAEIHAGRSAAFTDSASVDSGHDGGASRRE